tara:strand:+ start:25225 stop:26154 length:930 start_codon:yes stop_codon:yes gene_type:complete
MNSATTLTFSTPPPVLSQYLRAVFARGKNSAAAHPAFPALQAGLNNVTVNTAKAERYARVCEFTQTENEADILPCTYPHILSFPLQMELMLHKDFPLPLLGLVHIRNSMTQYRPIRLREPLNIRCRLGRSQRTEKGIEFDICSEVSSGDEMLWQSVSTYFFRQRRAAQNRPPKTDAGDDRRAAARFDYSECWQLASDLGRRYARVSADSNPIHLFAFSARLFGFKRHIAHGMWSKARIAASLSKAFSHKAFCLTTEFRAPVFLPSQVTLNYSRLSATAVNGTQAARGFRFELTNKRGDKTHVAGELRAL